MKKDEYKRLYRIGAFSRNDIREPNMENDIKEPQQAWNEFVAVMKKERFVQKYLVGVFCLLMLNWLICSFIGWSLNPHLTQMEVLMHSLDFFEWNFKIE